MKYAGPMTVTVNRTSRVIAAIRHRILRGVLAARLRCAIGRSSLMATMVVASALPACAIFANDTANKPAEVFVSGNDGYKSYRIPSLLTTRDGTVLAFCEGRKNGRGDSGDIDLLVKRSSDAGRTWSKASVVWNDGENTCGNPCPVVDQSTGHIHMLMTWNRGSDHGKELHAGTARGTRRVFYCRSEDDGLTWSQATEITEQAKDKRWWWYATGPGVGIQLTSDAHKGRLVIPCNHTADGYHFGAHVIYSDDAGKTWNRSNAIQPTCNESQIVELSDGRLMMNMRSQDHDGAGRPRNGYRSIAFSSNGGAAWSEPKFDQHLGDPVCQASIIRYDDTRLLFSNPAPEINAKRGKRVRMTLRMSSDDGKTWPIKRVIDDGPSAYSCLARLPDGRVGLLYESGTSISMATIPISALRSEKSTEEDDRTSAAISKPNVLFLCVDDMKDWVNCLGGYEGTVYTPNIDRLAERAMLFTNAHCASPKCAPSRTAVLTGLRPSTTGLYDNGHWWLPNLPNVVTLPMHFRRHGYRVVGAGKIFHHTAGSHPPNQWDAFHRLTFQEDPWFRSAKLNYPWSLNKPYPQGFPFSGVKDLGHENDWGTLPILDDEYDDVRTANFAVEFLRKRGRNEDDAPFFLACGLFRPHLPWYAPKKYFDRYPLDEIVLPKVRDNDLDDLPSAGLKFAKARREDFETIRRAGKWKHAIRAYLASITYADDQLGRVLDALDESTQARNTIIVLWSDHGWHLGEKRHWHKTTLWEEATRVPLIISAPGYAPGACAHPVSLLDMFPTLIDLTGLPRITSHDGVSLSPLLREPTSEWKRPAVIEFRRGNAAVRSARFRYIRYQDGGEELYDHLSDPYEWTNLAASEDHAALKSQMASWIAEGWADSAETKSAFRFDHTTFTWTHKKSGNTIHGEVP